MRRLFTLAFALVTSITPPAHADGWVDVDASFIDYNNLTHAQNAEDRRPDRALARNLSGGHYIAFSGRDGISLTLDTRAEVYRRYTGLDFLSVGGTAVYKRKFGLSANVPWVLASVFVAHDDYRANVRDSDRLRIGAELGRRFSKSFDGAIGVALDRRNGKSDIADDPAFRDPNLYAYRLPATTYSGTLSASRALSDQSSINFAYVDSRARAGYGLAYNDRALTLSIAHRYA